VLKNSDAASLIYRTEPQSTILCLLCVAKRFV